MAALAYLLNLGFAAKLSGKRVRVSPASKLNDQVRAYIKNHRLELLPSWHPTMEWSAGAIGRLCVMGSLSAR